MDAVHRASAFLFYLFGAIFIPLIILNAREVLSPMFSEVVHSLDLPLLFVAALYAASSMVVSLTKGRKSFSVLLGVFVPIGVLFAVFCWFNFAIPFREL